MRYPPYSRLLLGVKLGFALLLLGALLVWLKPVRLWGSLREVDPGLVFLAVLLGVVGVLVQWLKWQKLLNACRAETTWSEGLTSLLTGFALGLFSPGRLGELGRGVFLGGDRTMWVGLAGLDRLTSFAVTLGAAWLGLLMLYPAGALGTALLLGGVAAVFLLGWRIGVRRMGKWDIFLRVRVAFQRIPRGLWGEILGWSALFNVIFFGQFYLLINNWVKLPPEAIWGIPLVFGIKAVLPFSFSDLGVREGAAVVVFSRFGVDPVPAFNAAFLLFVINVLLPGLIGTALLYWQVMTKLGGSRCEHFSSLMTGKSEVIAERV